MRKIGVLLLGCFVGCQDNSVVDHSRDPDRFAESVKELVSITVADARESGEPADALSALVEELSDEELSYRPTDGYLEIYKEIQSIALSSYERAEAVDGAPPGLEDDLNRMVDLAEGLPGDLGVLANAEFDD